MPQIADAARISVQITPVLAKGALADACRNPVPKPLAKRLKERGTPHKVVITAIPHRPVTIAKAIPKTGETWRPQAG